MTDNQTVDDLTYSYIDETGRMVRRELAKEVLTKGAWATILYKYQDIDRKTDDFGAEKAAIVRYRKRQGIYKRHKEFAISNAGQARKILETLSGWFPAEP